MGRQRVYFKSHKTGLTQWAGYIASRDLTAFPLTAQGKADFESAVKSGNFKITADNGGIVPQGTPPTLVPPSAPNASYPSYSSKIQSENASGTGSYTGAVGDGTQKGFYTSPNDYLLYGFTGAPVTDNLYTLTFGFMTTFESGTAKFDILINNVLVNVTSATFNNQPVDVTNGISLPATSGTTHDLVITGISLQQGDNQIRIQGRNAGTFAQDYLTVSHPASA